MQAIVGTEKLNLEHKTDLTPDPEAPLVYLVHGRAGNFDVMWTFKRAIGNSCNIIAPQAFIPENLTSDTAGGFSWWLLNKEADNRGAINAAAARLVDFMDQAEDLYNLNPRKRIAFGFSQGAALLSLIAQQKPEKFDAMAMLAGFVVESVVEKDKNLPNLFMAHGTKDQIIDISLSQKGRAFLEESGYSVEYHSEETTHKVGSKSMRELTAWFARQI